MKSTRRLILATLVVSSLAGYASASPFRGLIDRCKVYLGETMDIDRGYNMVRGALSTLDHLRHGMPVPADSPYNAPPSINPLELARLMKILVVDGDQLGFTREASRLALKYGGAAYIPLATGFGNSGAVVVVDPALVSEVFQRGKDGDLVRGADFDILRQFIGHGTLSTDHEEHERRRNAIMPFFFHPTRIAAMVPQMNATIERFLNRLGTAADNSDTVNFHELMKETTLGVITKVLYNYDVSDEEARIISESLATALDFSTRYSIPVTLFQNAREPISEPVFLNAVQNMETIAHRIIRWRLAHPLPGDFSTADLRSMNPSECDVLSYIFKDIQLAAGATPTDAQMRVLRDEVMTLMLAGHETTANAITWTWVNLLETPEVLHRMVAEVDSALGGKTATFAQFRSLPFTYRVHREALRHDSPVYWFARNAERSTNLGPYYIPAGTHVFFSTLAVHRHPQHWPDGDRFDPDRFTGDGTKPKYGGAECPFAGGGNFCVGQPVAVTELNLISMMIAQHYELFPSGDGPAVREGKVTLQPQGGFWVRVRRRTPSIHSAR